MSLGFTAPSKFLHQRNHFTQGALTRPVESVFATDACLSALSCAGLIPSVWSVWSSPARILTREAQALLDHSHKYTQSHPLFFPVGGTRLFSYFSASVSPPSKEVRWFLWSGTHKMWLYVNGSACSPSLWLRDQIASEALYTDPLHSLYLF